MDAIRYDAVPLRAVRTPEGYLRDTPVIARTGVQTYNMGGRLVREYKPASVYDAAALAAIQGLPLIDRHKAAITSANVREHIIGTVLSPGRLDGSEIGADVIVYDEAPVKAGRKELSLAYAVTVDETPGVAPDGSPYDQIVTSIRRFDHLATVERGRAGVARLRVDSADDGVSADLAADDAAPDPGSVPAEPAVRSDSPSDPINRQEGQRMAEMPLVSVRLDGVNVAVPQDVATAIEKLRADAAATTDKARADAASVVEKARADAVAAADKARADVAALTARADAAEAQRDAEKTRADAAEARIPQVQAEAAAAVRARLALETAAKQHGVDVRADASDLDLKSAVILKLAPTATLAGKSPEYISARLDAELERAATQQANGAAQAAAAAPPPATTAARADAQATGTRNDVETAYAEYLNELQTRWKGAA